MRYIDVQNQNYHLQGFTADGEYMYWSFTDSLVKTTMEGTVVRQVPCAVPGDHLGGIDWYGGRIYGAAMNSGKKTSAIHVYDADTLQTLAILPLAECDAEYLTEEDGFRGAGCITAGKDPGSGEDVLLVGSALRSAPEITCQVLHQYGFDGKRQKKHLVPTGVIHLGIQNIDRDPETGCYWMTGYDAEADYMNRETLYCVSPDLKRVLKKYCFCTPYGIHCMGSGRFLLSLQAGVNRHRIGYAYEADTAFLEELDKRALREEDINGAVLPLLDTLGL